MSPVEAAAALKCSRPRIGHIEKGRNVLSYAELFKLLKHHYGADDATISALEELREEGSKRGWWSSYGLPERLAGIVGLEHDASSIRVLELEMIPGLLQTEEYAATQYSLDDHWSAKDIQRRVAVRMQRQQRLGGDDPVQLTCVVSEAALVRCARHQPVAAGQLAQLMDRAQWPNIEVRILPFDVGLHVGSNGPFGLWSFPDNLLPDAAYQEYAVGNDVIDDQAAVSRLARLFSKLRSQALGTDESLALIAELADKPTR